MLKLAHLAVSVSNLERSKAFYRRHFGFRTIEEYKFASAGMMICVLKKDAVYLELFQFAKCRSLPGYRKDLFSDLKTVGVKHFAFAAAHIKVIYNKLKKSGVKFAADLRVFENGRRYFFIKDPDGILIEIMEVK